MNLDIEGVVVSSSTKWTLELIIKQFKALNFSRITVVPDMDSPEARDVLQLAESLEVDNIMPLHVGGYIETIIQQVYNAAKCKWVLRLDDDEALSEDLAELLDRLDDDEEASDYYHIPRAHISSITPYLYYDDNRRFGSSERWADLWPNYQLRLFRNGHCLHHGILHEGPEGKGTGGYLNWPILHYNLLKPKEERQRIVDKYHLIGGEEEIRGDLALWEQQSLKAPIPCPYKLYLPN